MCTSWRLSWVLFCGDRTIKKLWFLVFFSPLWRALAPQRSPSGNNVPTIKSTTSKQRVNKWKMRVHTHKIFTSSLLSLIMPRKIHKVNSMSEISHPMVNHVCVYNCLTDGFTLWQEAISSSGITSSLNRSSSVASESPHIWFGVFDDDQDWVNQLALTWQTRSEEGRKWWLYFFPIGQPIYGIGGGSPCH